MVNRETARKTLSAKFGSTVSVDMERGFLKGWQQQGDNVSELLEKLEELSEAVKTPWNDKTDEILQSVDVMINEYRSNV